MPQLTKDERIRISINLTTNEQFPWKLHRLLDHAEKEGYESIVSWLPEGDTFKVHNSAKFASRVMPLYFNSTIYKSFQRNLSLWGFMTQAKGRGKGTCSHPSFRRNKPFLCYNMKRIKIKGEQREKADHHEGPSSDTSNSSRSSKHTAFEVTTPACEPVIPVRKVAIFTDLKSEVGLSNVGSIRSLLSAHVFEQLSLPLRIHFILASYESNVLDWSSDGRSLRVLSNHNQSSEALLRETLRCNNMEGLITELKSYGFHQQPSMATDGAFVFRHDVSGLS